MPQPRDVTGSIHGYRPRTPRPRRPAPSERRQAGSFQGARTPERRLDTFLIFAAMLLGCVLLIQIGILIVLA